MGRLENIIARNQRPRGSRERLYVSVGFGVTILVILALMVFTDLGKPPVPARSAKPPAAGPAAPVPAPRGQRVDGVLLRSPPTARPAPH
jgi:cell division protein FtsN